MATTPAPKAPISSTTALFGYVESGVDLVRALKFGNRRSCLPELVKALAPSLPAQLDILVPVPADPNRSRRRGYDLPELVARSFAHTLNLPSEQPLRRLDAGSQRLRNRLERNDLVRYQAQDSCEGRVLLVDDVLTTGATARACAAELLRVGAKEIHLCVLAATPPPGLGR